MTEVFIFALVAGMTWIKLDDKAPRHPKISGLSDKAFRWWIAGLCYSSEFLTNGALPKAFYSNVPKQVRAELTSAGLWEFTDPNLNIHDYLQHQQSRESVEGERRRNRDRRRGTSCTTGTTTGTTAGSTGEKPRPEVEADVPERSDTEQKEQRQQRGVPLIMSPERYAKRLQHCAFVGSRIEVPHSLHDELRRAHGGADPERELQDWYLAFNEQAENEGWRIPTDKSFFPWFKEQHAKAFPVAHVNGTKRDDTAFLKRLEAIQRGEIKR